MVFFLTSLIEFSSNWTCIVLCRTYERKHDTQTFKFKHILTLGRTGVGGGEGGLLLLPSEDSLSFSLDDKTSTPDVFSSSSFIPRGNFKKSLVMVAFYGYEIRRRVRAGGQAIFQ